MRAFTPASPVLTLIALIALNGCGDGGTVGRSAPPEVDTTDMEPQVAALLASAREAVIESPDSPDGWFRLAGAFDAHGLDEAAVEAYRRAIDLAPEDFGYRYNLAVAAESLQTGPDGAARLLEEAEAIDAAYAPLQMRLGDALVRDGRLDDAAAAYLRAIEIEPEMDRARRSLGQVLLTLERTEEALEQLEIAAARHPDDAPTAAALAQAYTRTGDAALASAAARRSEGGTDQLGFADPLRNEVLRLGISSHICRRRAERKIDARDFTGALRDLSIVAEVDPDDPWVHYRLGTVSIRAGRPDQALEHLERAVDLDDAFADAVVELAGVCTTMRRFDDATEQYRRALELDPDRGWVRWLLAAALAQSGAFDDALVEFERANLDSPDDPRGQLNWGTTLMQAGRFELALERFSEAARLRPDYVAAWCNLGIVSEQLGRTDEAVAYYRRAFDLDPNCMAARRLAELGR